MIEIIKRSSSINALHLSGNYRHVPAMHDDRPENKIPLSAITVQGFHQNLRTLIRVTSMEVGMWKLQWKQIGCSLVIWEVER